MPDPGTPLEQAVEEARQASNPVTSLSRYMLSVTRSSDPATLVRLAGPALLKGRAQDVHGTNVALSTSVTRQDGSSYHVGDTLTVVNGSGQTTTLRVAALFDRGGYPLLTTSLLCDDTVLPLDPDAAVTENWFLTPLPARRTSSSPPWPGSPPAGAGVTTGQGWTQAVSDAEVRRWASNSATTTGGICLLAVAVMVQQTLALARSRRHETRLLLRTGASRSTLVTSALAQTAGLQILGLGIAAVTLAAAWAWLAYVLVPYYDDLTGSPAVPWSLLTAAVITAVVVPLATTLATTVAATLRAKRPRR